MLAVAWLVGWAAFSVPWSSFTSKPEVGQVDLIPFNKARRADQILNFLYYVPAGALGIGLGFGPLRPWRVQLDYRLPQKRLRFFQDADSRPQPTSCSTAPARSSARDSQWPPDGARSTAAAAPVPD